MEGNTFFRNSVKVFALYGIIGIALYFPVAGNQFLSDDYDSLYRISIEKRILYREFLRPMIDISFYFNWLISGLSPWSYYVFNIGVHIANACLLYRLALRYVLFQSTDQYVFAALSGLLFLIYPFHNESIVWLSGRLSSMACLFALLSIGFALDKKGWKSFVGSSVCYLMGLLCYESIFFLPAIIWMIQWSRDRSFKKALRSGIYWTLVVVLYLVVRYTLSGEVTGDYGGRITQIYPLQKMLNTGKVFGRLFLPPSENQTLLLIGTSVLLIGCVASIRYMIKTKITERPLQIRYYVLLLVIVVSLFIPFLFGVSTRTTEGDRLLYFPSCFICLVISSAILWLCNTHYLRMVCVTIVAMYFIIFLERNNLQWIRASHAARDILSRAKATPENGHTVIINLPDELEGAFVFRNGFKKALIVNQIDTSRIIVVNMLKRVDYLNTGKTIVPELTDSAVTIFPVAYLRNEASDRLRVGNTENKFTVNLRKDRNLLYYWNKEELMTVTCPFCK